MAGRVPPVPAYEPLPPAYFDRPTLDVARDLLGAWLVRETDDGVIAGRVVETEGYTFDDPAYHGWRALDAATGLVVPTGRAHDLFGPPGRAYVYRVYDRHWMLNVVTEREGVCGSVLVRALEPVRGLDALQARRPAARSVRDLCSGPGRLTEAFGIDGATHGADLTQPPLYFARPAEERAPEPVTTSSRVGLTRGIDLPWRFFFAGDPFVSPGVPSDVAAARRRKTGGPPRGTAR